MADYHHRSKLFSYITLIYKPSQTPWLSHPQDGSFDRKIKCMIRTFPLAKDWGSARFSNYVITENDLLYLYLIYSYIITENDLLCFPSAHGPKPLSVHLSIVQTSFCLQMPPLTSSEKTQMSSTTYFT